MLASTIHSNKSNSLRRTHKRLSLLFPDKHGQRTEFLLDEITISMQKNSMTAEEEVKNEACSERVLLLKILKMNVYLLLKTSIVQLHEKNHDIRIYIV